MPTSSRTLCTPSMAWRRGRKARNTSLRWSPGERVLERGRKMFLLMLLQFLFIYLFIYLLGNQASWQLLRLSTEELRLTARSEFKKYFFKNRLKLFLFFPLRFQYHPPGQNPSHTPQMHGPKLPVESENKLEIFDYSKEN